MIETEGKRFGQLSEDNQTVVRLRFEKGENLIFTLKQKTKTQTKSKVP